MFCRISEDHLSGPGSLGERLRALPSFTPPPGGWARLQARRHAARRRFAMAGGGLALAASLLVPAVASAQLPAGPVTSKDVEFVANFAEFASHVEEGVRQAGPKVAA